MSSAFPAETPGSTEDDENRTTGIIEPRDNDVLCGRGGAALRHPGNQTYRHLVNINKGLYITCLKNEKLKISRSIVAAIREQKGRFLDREGSEDKGSDSNGPWYDIGDKKAIEKTSQALREGQPKLRQKIAELGAVIPMCGSIGGNTVNLPSDINPHNLPYGHQQNQNMNNRLGTGLTSFQGPSMHSIGSGSFSMGESAILSLCESMQSAPYNHNGQAEIIAFRGGRNFDGNNNMQSASNFSMQQQQQQQDQLGMMQQNAAHRLYQDAATMVPSSQQQQQEFQVQRLQSATNPHHRDIQISEMAAPPNMLQSELLQRLSLHDFSVNSGNYSTGLPNASGLSGLECSAHTLESNTVNTINTFTTMQTNVTTNSNVNTNNDNGHLVLDKQKQMILARELGIDVSQLSLFTESASLQSPTGHSGLASDVMSVDSFKRALQGMPLGGSEKFSTNSGVDYNNQNMQAHGNTDGVNQVDRGNHGDNIGTMNNGINPQISHITLGDINQSLTSCISNHSAFNMNGSSLNGNNMNGSSFNNMGPTSIRVNNSYQQFVQQQQQQQMQQQNLIQDSQNQIQRQIQQQRQLHQQQQQLHQSNLQQQQYLMQQHLLQQQQIKSGNDNGNLNTQQLNKNSLNYNNHNNGKYSTSRNNTSSSGGNSDFDRRSVFAKMKFSRPPSIREQPEVPSGVNGNGPMRHQMQSSNQQGPRQAPEVTTIKISDGINRKNKTSKATSTGQGRSNHDETQADMTESNRSMKSNQSMMSETDGKEQGEEQRGKKDFNKKNEVYIEVTKIVDHSSMESRMNACSEAMGGGSKMSLMSGLSRISDASCNSIISDLSKKIGNVSTRSMAMSEMSSVDYIDIEENDNEDDDDSSTVDKDGKDQQDEYDELEQQYHHVGSTVVTQADQI